jgi:hypothetical protein
MAPKISTALTPFPGNSYSQKGIQSEWPSNTYFEELDDFSTPRGDQWLDHESPPELQQVAIDAPLEVIQIVQESSSREQYLRSAIQSPTKTSEEGRESASETELDILRYYSDISPGKYTKDQNVQAVQPTSPRHRKAGSSGSITWLCSRRARQKGPYQHQKSGSEDYGFMRLLKERKAIG